MRRSGIRAAGATVALGGVMWGASWVFSPSTQEVNNQVEIWASAVFQLGLLALLAVVWATAATGTGRWARAVVAAETVAVVLAIGWTVPHLFEANREQDGLLPVLDLFWPVSMAGLIVMGAMVAWARRWPTHIRYLPLAASLTLAVDLATAWAPEPTRSLISGLYLAGTYGLLGFMIVRDAQQLSDQMATPPASAGRS